MKTQKRKKSLIGWYGKRSFEGYLRTDESISPQMVVIFIYKRRDKKYGVTTKVRITLEELS